MEIIVRAMLRYVVIQLSMGSLHQYYNYPIHAVKTGVSEFNGSYALSTTYSTDITFREFSGEFIISSLLSQNNLQMSHYFFKLRHYIINFLFEILSFYIDLAA